MRGRVTFTAGGAEYALRFTTNRLCTLEETSGRSVMKFAEALGDPGAISFSDIRLLMQTGIEGDFTADQVGDIIDMMGVQAAAQMIAKAFGAAFQVDDKPAAGKPKAATA